jgi:hypothetical protein
MKRAGLLVALLASFVWACDGDGTGPTTLEGTFALVAENDVPLPSDHGEPDGCCDAGEFSYLLGPGTVSADNSTVTLLYGDEGPGSDQIRATFRR